MVLSGWNQSPEEDANKSVDNAESTLKALPAEAEKSEEIETASAKKRKLAEVSKNGGTSNAEETRKNEKLQVLDDDDDDLVIFDGGDFGSWSNKKRQR